MNSGGQLGLVINSRLQVTQRLAVGFRWQPALDLARLEAWLSATFSLSAARHHSESVQSHWLNLVFLLARELMQAGRVPVFDLHQIATIEADPQVQDRWVATLIVPSVELMAPDAWRHAVDAAAAACLKAARSTSDEPVDLAELDQQVVLALQKIIPGGKSTIPVLRAAHMLGIPFIHLGLGAYQLGWGSRARRISRGSSAADSAIGSRLSASKASTAALLRMAGLPAPEHSVARSVAQAQTAAGSLGWPVVVKPADRERGEGVMVDVDSDDKLQAAFVAALALSRARQVLVERQVAGVCHRIFVAGGEVLYAVKRLPMSVRGDGVHTFAQLVRQELDHQRVKAPWRRSEIRDIDDAARAALAREGLSPSSVLADGAFAPLRRLESTADGGVDEDVSALVHPGNRLIAIQAARLFGLDMAGIDLITADISRPWFETGAIINEVNFSPVLGGGEISRGYLPGFLRRFVDGDGRIPIEVFAGGEPAFQSAVAASRKRAESGERCWVTSANRTLDDTGQDVHLALNGLDRRIRALLLDWRVDSLALVVQDDELLATGLQMAGVGLPVVIDEKP